MFTGGSDISPALYGEPNHPSTHAYPERDLFEVQMYKWAVAHRLPMIGICRGAQLLCIMNGGRLIQHVDHHAGGYGHIMETHVGGKMQVNSLHHQMMDLNEDNDNYEVRGWANNIATVAENGYGENLKTKSDWYQIEPEAVWWPRTKSFGVQYHPEMLPPDHMAVTFFQQQVDELGLLQ